MIKGFVSGEMDGGGAFELGSLFTRQSIGGRKWAIKITADASVVTLNILADRKTRKYAAILVGNSGCLSAGTASAFYNGLNTS